jgi:hypothetical protein
MAALIASAIVVLPPLGSAAPAVGAGALPPSPDAMIRLARMGEFTPGTYNAVGTNPNGSKYRATVVLRQDGNIWRASWLISNGDTFKGEGRIKDGRLVIDWGQKYPVIYESGQDGVLYGTWDNGRGSEILTRK